MFAQNLGVETHQQLSEENRAGMPDPVRSSLTQWVTHERMTAKVHTCLDLNGLDRLPWLVTEIMNRDPSG